MTHRTPGWYPDPDIPGGLRWWNGSQWTAEPAPSGADASVAQGAEKSPAAHLSTPPTKPRFSRRLLLVGAAVAVIIVVAVVTIALSLSSGGQAEAEVTPTDSAAPAKPLATASPTSPPVFTPAPAPEPVALALGETLTSTSFAITMHSVEVADEFPTVQGAPLVAESGTDLVLVRGTYTVLGPNGVDLTCARYDIFTQAYDSAGGEMANLFAEPDLEGNPPCNDKLLTGQSSDWVFAFKMVEGRQPDHLSVIDKNFHGPDAWGEPTMMLLR